MSVRGGVAVARAREWPWHGVGARGTGHGARARARAWPWPGVGRRGVEAVDALKAL